MRKKSKHFSYHYRERGMVESRMKQDVEWPSEGSPKSFYQRVGADGNRTRYQSGVYVCT